VSVSLLDAAMANPWAALRTVLDGPLHPGGTEATADLLDRAGVGEGTRLLDVGCGTGESLALARDRGARAVGLDRGPGGSGALRGELTTLPVHDDAVDVVLSECVLSLAGDPDRALAEARRVVPTGGHLAISDIVAGDPPDLPAPMANALSLGGARDREALRAGVADAGFAVESIEDRRGDLLAMRDQIAAAVDYERLLAALGERGERLLAGIEDLEAAVEEGRVGYVSLVATAE